MRHCPLIVALALAACTSDLNAPSNYLGSSSETGGGLLAIDCGMLPAAAVGADFMGMITASGGDGMYMFSGTVPDGLALDTTTGAITGVPTTAGPAMFDITVVDGSGGTGMTTCSLPIAEHVDVDLALDTVPYCLNGGPGQTLIDVVKPGTGLPLADSPITCDHPTESGTGTMPDGISIDPTTCQITGTLMDSRYGTWAFMVRGQQAGAEVYIPYCVTNSQQGTFTITGNHSGRMDNVLEPMLRLFDPTMPVFAGAPMDPLIRAVDPNACGGDCNYFAFSFFINASGFEAGDTSVDIYDDDNDGNMTEPKPIIVFADLYNDGSNDVGLQHEMRLDTNTPLTPPLDGRTWVVNLSIDYCLGTMMNDCPDNNVSGNADGFLVFSVIMVPQP